MKNLKSILFSLVAVTAIALSMTSCEQKALIDEVGGIENSLSDDNVFKFDNVEAFMNYYDQLNMLYDEDDQEFNRVAEAIGINTVHKKITNDVFVNPEDRYQPFLADPIMMAISNEHFEFQIENVLMTQITNGFILASDINDKETRTQLRSMKKGSSLNINDIPAKSYPVSNESVETMLGPWSSKEYDRAEAMNLLMDMNLRGNDCETEGDAGWGWDEGIYFDKAISFRTKLYTNWCCMYEEAKVYGYKKINGVWKNEKAEISATISTWRRDKNCNQDFWTHEDDECNNCKSKRARLSTGKKRGHKSNDVCGSYRKKLGGNTLQTDTSISATQCIKF